MVAPVQHRVADVVSGRVGGSGHLSPQACQVRRARVLREVVNLQNHRLPGGGGQQHRTGEARVLGQVMVVDPPHPVPETAPEQVGKLALTGCGGGRIVIPHGVEPAAFDRPAEAPVVRTTATTTSRPRPGNRSRCASRARAPSRITVVTPPGSRWIVENVQIQNRAPSRRWYHLGGRLAGAHTRRPRRPAAAGAVDAPTGLTQLGCGSCNRSASFLISSISTTRSSTFWLSTVPTNSPDSPVVDRHHGQRVLVHLLHHVDDQLVGPGRRDLGPQDLCQGSWSRAGPWRSNGPCSVTRCRATLPASTTT